MKKNLIKTLFWLVLLAPLVWAEPSLEERVREIASELRCVVCQNLSVADSPSEMAVQMRGIVREQLEEGKSPEEIKAYFVSKYGEWVLLAPPRTGFNLIVWILPFVVLAVALSCAGWVLYRWSRKRSVPSTKDADPALLERVREEMEDEVPPAGETDDPVARAKNRVYTDLQELEFDYQAGKISPSDYDLLRRRYENQAASIMAQERPPRKRAVSTSPPDAKPNTSALPITKRRWILPVTGAALVVGGVAVGLLLGQSLRPRASSEDSITGDFLTGTDGTVRTTDRNINELLSQGQMAFERRELKKAIDSFKEVLRADPGNAVANAYMGLILVQAGHSDAALLALDRALARAPRLPVALWAKGMILYRENRDLDEAKRHLTTLMEMVPPGEDRSAIQQTIAEIDQATAASGSEETTTNETTLTGTIVLDPELAPRVEPGSVLFIIARRPGSNRGPPLAVKRVIAPSFPLTFALGEANTMIPGTAFDGAVDLTVRLDTDGNAMTREPGSLTGVYPQNPVPVGTKDVRVTIDQVVE